MARLDRRIKPGMLPMLGGMRETANGGAYAPSFEVVAPSSGRVTPATTYLSADSRIAPPTPARGARIVVPTGMPGGNERVCITLTTPVRVTATGAQELRLAIDVSAHDILDQQIRVLRLEGTGPSVTVEIQTGMQAESTEGWVTLASFGAISSAPSSVKQNFTGLLRYIRWNVTTLSGSGGPAATFMIEGTGRRWGR